MPSNKAVLKIHGAIVPDLTDTEYRFREYLLMLLHNYRGILFLH